MTKPQFHFTEAHKAFMREKLPGVPRREFAILFNEHFGLSLGLEQIIAATKRYGIYNGLDFRFRPGQVAHNKGKHVVYPGCEKTHFKKGHMPHNYQPVGSERINTDGYHEIKIADPKTWRGKHLIVWESVHGPLPKGHVVIFGDGNRQNFDPDNLILVSRAELALMNKKHLVGGSAELTRTGQQIARLYMGVTRAGKSKR